MVHEEIRHELRRPVWIIRNFLISPLILKIRMADHIWKSWNYIMLILVTLCSFSLPCLPAAISSQPFSLPFHNVWVFQQLLRFLMILVDWNCYFQKSSHITRKKIHLRNFRSFIKINKLCVQLINKEEFLVIVYALWAQRQIVWGSL